MSATNPRTRHRRLKVTFVGFERFWMDVLVKAIADRYAEEIEARWLLWPSTFRERVRFLWSVLTSRVVVRVGMPFEFDSETNRLWLVLLRVIPGLHGVNYWIGSDVVLYLERLASGRAGGRDCTAVARMAHFAGSEHLHGELAEAGIDARTVVLPSPARDVPAVPPAFPDHFRVLAYLLEPQARFEFYGGLVVFAAARALPDVQFDVVGAKDEGTREVPSNVHYLGRVEDMDEVYERSTVLVRLVQHDGVPSAMVEEALVFGRQVVYSFRWPHTHYIGFQDEDGLIALLRRLRDEFAAGALALNLEGREFTLEDWDPDRRAAILRTALLDVAAGRL